MSAEKLTEVNPKRENPMVESALDRLEAFDRSAALEGPRGLARFLWVDAETGDELAVDVRGTESFFEELENLGFERLGEGVQPDPRRSEKPRLSASVDVRPSPGERRAWRARRGA